MNTLSYRTKSAKSSEIEAKWFVIDAEGETLGRMCSRIVHALRGKHKPNYTPHVDCGDNVIVINADKVRLSGKKMQQKDYISHSNYPGGQKRITAENLLVKKPTALVENAIKGMLPKTKLGRQMYKKLFVYAGAEHKHDAQQPEPFKF